MISCIYCTFGTAKLELVIKEEAKNEIKDGYEWYESKQVNLGLRFIESIERCLTSIQQSPKLYAVWKKRK